MYTCESRETPLQTTSGTLESLSPQSKTMTFQLSLAGTVSVPTGHASAPSSLEFTIPIYDFSHNTGPSSPSGSLNGGSLNGGRTNSISSSISSQQTLFSDDKYHLWPLQEAFALRKPVFIDDLGGRAADFDKRGWDDDYRSAV